MCEVIPEGKQRLEGKKQEKGSEKLDITNFLSLHKLAHSHTNICEKQYFKNEPFFSKKVLQFPNFRHI